MTDLESALARAIVDLEVARERLAVAERERDAILAHAIHDDPEAGGWFYLDFWVKTFEDDDGGSEYVPMTSWIDNREGGRESAIAAVRKAAGLEG